MSDEKEDGQGKTRLQTKQTLVIAKWRKGELSAVSEKKFGEPSSTPSPSPQACGCDNGGVGSVVDAWIFKQRREVWSIEVWSIEAIENILQVKRHVTDALLERAAWEDHVTLSGQHQKKSTGNYRASRCRYHPRQAEPPAGPPSLPWQACSPKGGTTRRTAMGRSKLSGLARRSHPSPLGWKSLWGEYQTTTNFQTQILWPSNTMPLVRGGKRPPSTTHRTQRFLNHAMAHGTTAHFRSWEVVGGGAECLCPSPPTPGDGGGAQSAGGAGGTRWGCGGEGTSPGARGGSAVHHEALLLRHILFVIL